MILERPWAREAGLLPWWIDSAERSLSEAEAALSAAGPAGGHNTPNN
jgi:hypothetical protein